MASHNLSTEEREAAEFLVDHCGDTPAGEIAALLLQSVEDSEVTNS